MLFRVNQGGVNPKVGGGGGGLSAAYAGTARCMQETVGVKQGKGANEGVMGKVCMERIGKVFEILQPLGLN